MRPTSLLAGGAFGDDLLSLSFLEIDHLFSEILVGEGQDLDGEDSGVLGAGLAYRHARYGHARRHLDGAEQGVDAA